MLLANLPSKSQFAQDFPLKKVCIENSNFRNELTWPLNAQVVETPAEYIVVSVLPEVSVENIDVGTQDRVLTISVVREIRYDLPLNCSSLKSDCYSKRHTGEYFIPHHFNMNEYQCTFLDQTLFVRFPRIAGQMPMIKKLNIVCDEDPRWSGV